VRINRSLKYHFSLQQYESVDISASVTVDNNDLAIMDEELAKLDEAAYDRMVSDLTNLCVTELNNQLRPMLKEADDLCERQSRAHDVFDRMKEK
jgi:hypothetical protein